MLHIINPIVTEVVISTEGRYGIHTCFKNVAVCIFLQSGVQEKVISAQNVSKTTAFYRKLY